MVMHASQLYFQYDLEPLIADFSLKIDAPACLHICGENGSGKSTLLRILAGITRPQQGTLKTTESVHFFDANTPLKPGSTVGDTLAKWQIIFPKVPTKHLRSVRDLLLPNLPDTQIVDTLSGGETAKLKLFPFLCTHRRIWILDEPFTFLDPISQKILCIMMSAHYERRGVVLFTSHAIPNDFTPPYTQINLRRGGVT